MDNTNAIQMFKRAGLLKTGEYNYSEIANAFLSCGITSNSGNTYFNTVRLLEGIIIKEDVGQGYARTFLNGIRIYSINDKCLISERYYNCNYYNKMTVLSEVQQMLTTALKKAAEAEGIDFDENSIRDHVTHITKKCFNMDQRELLNNIYNKSLKA